MMDLSKIKLPSLVFLLALLVMGCEGDSGSPLSGGGDGNGNGGGTTGDRTPITSTVDLTWDASPEAEQVTSYIIYVGATEDAINYLAETVNVADLLDPTQPSISFNYKDANLGIEIGDQVCVQVYAVNASGHSLPSFPRCIVAY